MSAYFPYSHIIQSIYDSFRDNITKYSYFGEWYVCEQQAQPATQNCFVEISEIYY